MHRKAAVAAVALLGLDVLGRLSMMLTGLFPLTGLEQVVSITAGTTIAAAVALYLGLGLDRFRSR